MEKEEVDEIISCLGDERRIFHYFKSRYCFDLIEMDMERRGLCRTSVAQLKGAGLGRFLNNPVVSSELAKLGHGELQRDCIRLMGPVQRTPFVLTLDRWGQGDRGWDQTTRNQRNLVLQLNFDGAHDAAYRRLLKPVGYLSPFDDWGHPTSRKGRNTMAWVRLDICMASDEALIEEIQTDWLRNAAAMYKWVLARMKRNPGLSLCGIYPGFNGSMNNFTEYVNEILARYQGYWAEVAMLAALRFLRDEVGVGTVFHHSYKTGIKLKAVSGSPPRSIYSTLPRRFGFELTADVPDMLARHKFARRCIKTIAEPSWYRMEF